MTRSQLERAVAAATGESVRTIHRLGFGLQPAGAGDPSPDDLRLVVDCPFCGRPVPYPGHAGDGSPALAECARDDVYFDFDAAEVYAAGPADGDAA
jgi:hypothetical protein